MKDKLITDAQRDASSAIRGYVYQIYQSVLAWITITQDDELVLEGAEDFDVYESEEVVTTQVKDLQKALTLRSAAISETINNFWQHKKSNPYSLIRMRFLTTAPIGCEKGTYFGKGKKGIEIWNQINVGDEKEIESIRCFLRTLSLQDDLTEFIKTASCEQLHGELIARIRWDCGEKNSQGLQATIKQKLILHGEKRQVNAMDSANVLPFLVAYIANLFADRRSKHLNRSDFLLKFDEATSVNLSRPQFDSLIASNARGGAHMVHQAGHAIRVSKPLPNVRGVIQREKLVKTALDILATQKVLFLVGSSGMGKSNLASLMIQNSNKNWGWCSFRTLAPAMLKGGIEYLNHELDSGVLAPFLILDDVDFAKLHQFEQELIRLVYTAGDLGGNLIFTSHLPVEDEFLDAVWKSSETVFNVPPFSCDEIGELMINHGKEDVTDLVSLSSVILARTEGHPQLVHAEVRNCQAVAWKSRDIIKSADSRATKAVKRAARKKLLDYAPSQETRSLLYRLSIVHGSFNRQLAITIAAVKERISRPGEVLDQLIGPWVERIADNSFTVSPLLAGVADEVIEPAEIERVHNEIALQIFKRDKDAAMTPGEFGALFFHAFQAKNNAALFTLASTISTTEQAFQKYLYMELYWFTWKALGKGEYLVNDSPMIDVQLRLAQFDLLVSSNDASLITLVIQRAVDATRELNSNEPTEEVMKAYVFFRILNNVNAKISIVRAMELFVEFMDFGGAALASIEMEKLDEMPLPPAPSFAGTIIDDPVQLSFFAQIERLSSIADLKALFKSLNALEAKKRDIILGWLSERNEIGYFTLHQVYWKEIKDSKTDKAELLAEFESLSDTLSALQSITLYVVCQVVVANIYNELLDDAPTALAVLNTALTQCPDKELLYNELAKVHFNKGEIPVALAFTKKAIEGGWLPASELVYRSRDLAMAAHRAGHWNEVAKYYLDCVARCRRENVPDDLLWVGLLADGGFALWKTGEYQKSLETLKEVLLKLESIELGDDIRSWHLHATVRHCIAWVALNSEDNAVEDIFEPVPGMCSSQNPVKAIRSHDLKPLRLLWSMLSTAEMATDCDVGICEHVESLSTNQLDFSQISFENGQRFQRALKLRLFEDYVHRVHDLLNSMDFTQKIISKEIAPEKLTQLPLLQPKYWRSEVGQQRVCHYLLVGCVYDFANNGRLTIDTAKWAKQLKILQMEGDLTEKLLFALSGGEVEQEPYLNSAVSLFWLSENKVAPLELWWMTFHLLRTFGDTKVMVEKPLTGILVEVWKLVLDGYKDKLLDPYVARMKIGMACVDSEASGFNKLARILLIARDFLAFDFPENVIELLRQLKE